MKEATDKAYLEATAEALGRSWGQMWRGMHKEGMPRWHATVALAAYIVSGALSSFKPKQ